ncbi:MAG: hypothetical protein OXL40_06690 [Bacteroidota bacterium]|nr:hypothetical protein [Bacteroidota bacterium]
MKLVLEKHDLEKITPAALITYVEDNGWKEFEPYRKHSTVYVKDDKPKILVPNKSELADYVQVVYRLIKMLAIVSDKDEIAIYHELINTKEDMINNDTLAFEITYIGPALKDGMDVNLFSEITLAINNLVKSAAKVLLSKDATDAISVHVKSISTTVTERGGEFKIAFLIKAEDIDLSSLATLLNTTLER